jgi:hypothetical protein
LGLRRAGAQVELAVERTALSFLLIKSQAECRWLFCKGLLECVPVGQEYCDEGRLLCMIQAGRIAGNGLIKNQSKLIKSLSALGALDRER